MKYQGSDYMMRLLIPGERKLLLERAVQELEFSAVEFDAMAFTGMSGALLAPGLADILDKSLLMVRKKGTWCHSRHIVEGDVSAKTYIVVDDMCSTGATITRVMAAVNSFHPEPPSCVGVLMCSDMLFGEQPCFLGLEILKDEDSLKDLGFSVPNRLTRYLCSAPEERDTLCLPPAVDDVVDIPF